jgi:hypothetical protein
LSFIRTPKLLLASEKLREIRSNIVVLQAGVVAEWEAVGPPPWTLL